MIAIKRHPDVIEDMKSALMLAASPPGYLSPANLSHSTPAGESFTICVNGDAVPVHAMLARIGHPNPFILIPTSRA